MFVHHKWNSSGRTRRNTEKPTEFEFTTACGDTDNVDLGGGEYAPYLWDGTNLLHGKSKSVFSAGSQAHEHAGKQLSTTKFFITKFNGVGYDTLSHGLPERSVEELDDHANVHLDFNTPDYAFRVTQIASPGSRGEYRFVFTPAEAGIYVIEWVEEGIVPGTSNGKIITAPGKDGAKAVGVEFADTSYVWDYEEADKREVTVEVRGAKRKLIIKMGDFSLSAGEELVISPDTFGPSQIAIDTRDGQEEADTTWLVSGADSDGNRVGNVSTIFDMGMSWDGVTIPNAATISSATIELFMKWQEPSSDIVTRMQGFDVDDVAVFNGTTNRPSQITQTTALVDRTYTNASDWSDESWLSLDDAATIIQEIVDRAGWASGQALGVVLKDNGSAASSRWQFQDYGRNTSQAAKITIVYTTGGTDVLATTDALVITENVATVNAETNTQAGTDTLALTEFATTVTLSAGTDVLAATDALLLTEQNATISVGINTPATTDSLLITEHSPTVNAAKNVPASKDTLTLSALVATITKPIVKAVSIDGQGTKVLNTNYGSTTLYFNKQNYFTI